MSFGFGGGGFGQNNQGSSNAFGGGGGGGFGANTNPAPAFGSSSAPAFGAPANNNTGNNLFGGATGGFGNTGGAFGSGASAGGFGAKPAFGTPTTSSGGGGLFGSTTATTGNTGFGGGAFGGNNAASSSPFGGGGSTSLFGGGQKPATGFGTTANTAPGTGGGLFGGGGGGFGGGNTSSAFGGATNNPGIGTNVGEPPGTNVLAFSPYLEKEGTGTAQNSFQNLLFQEPYKKFSAEELRMVDYAQGRQFGNGPAGGGGAFGATSGFGGTGFGNNTQQSTGFGAANTGGGLFGNTQAQQPSTGFGQTPANTGGFGAGAGAGGGLFGQNKPATGGLFGSSATTQPQQTGGLFGSTGATGGFGSTQNAAPSTGFGANAGGGGLFGNNTQNKPATGFGTSFGATPAAGGFGSNTGTNNAFGQQNNTQPAGGGLFGNTNTQNSPAPGGGLFGATNQQQTQPGAFGSSFGQTNQQQTGGGLFGNQNKPATPGGGLFGNTNTQQQNTGTGGLFGNAGNTTTGFGQTNTQQQQPGGLFGAQKPATTGGLFGQTNTSQPGQTGGGLFGGLGSNTQQQQQQQNPGSSLFGGLGNSQNQQKPSLFGQPQQSTGGGLFGSQPQQQQTGGGLFGQSANQQPQQNSLLGGSMFNNSQNQQSTPQSLTASISDPNAFGPSSLFSGLGNGEVQNPGPLATPLSGKKKERKGSVLPMWKLNPGSAQKFVTPVKRGFGLSYSTYGSPATPSSANSTPGGFGQSLLGAGSLNKSLSKSVSSNLRKSFNAEDSILAPGSFSSTMGPRPYGSAGLKRLNIDKSLRLDLFSSPTAQKAPDSDNGPRKLPKRVSFDTSNVDVDLDGVAENGTPETPSASAQDLGFIRPTNGNGTSVDGAKTRSADATPEMEQVRGNELAVVHEEESPSLAAASSPDKGSAGTYWTSPSKEEILKMNRVQRSAINNFTVGRENVGQVQFRVAVDLTNIDLEEITGSIVVLETRSCTVYPVAAKKPPVGKGLNVPSVISLEHSWPRGRDKRTPLADKSGRHLNKHVERLKKIPDTRFIDYDAETGVWTFEVEHFTTYGLDYDEDDTDGDTTLGEIIPEEAALPSQPKSAFQTQDKTSPPVEPEDTFEFRRKRRALPGAFDYSGAVSDDEEELADANQQSFLSDRSAGSASQALVHQEDEEMDEEHALPEDQDASAYLGYHQAAEPDHDSHYNGSMAEYQEMPGGIMRARMRAIKASNTPLRLQVADGDDWMDMLQKTITPAKRDRAALKTINEEEAYEDLKASTRQDPPQAKSRAVSDGRGFATSIELMNSLFDKPRASVRPSAPAVIPTSGFKWPYKRQDKTTDEDEADMDPTDKAFHDSLRPSWGPDGTLVLATAPKVLTRSSKRGLDKDGIMAMSKLNIVSENRDVRFAKFSNESSAKALNNQMSLTRVNLVNHIPTVSLGPVDSLTALFHGQDLQSPANAHEKMVWELASILFDHVTDAEGGRVASGLRQARRRNLSKFWQNAVEDASNRAVGMARSLEDKAIASLSGNRVPDACKYLLDGKNFRLATLVSLIGTSDQLMQDMREQVKEWRDTNVLSEFTEPIRAIYELLSGNVCAVEGKKGAMENRMESFIISQRFGMDWKQALGLRFWYTITSSDDIVEAIHSFEDDIRQDKEPRPQPWYAEQGIPALWEDPDADLREDLLWGLLKLYADKEIDLADVLRPENSQLSPLDFRLSWQLGQALVNTGKVAFGEDAEEKADAATLSFASQLTNDGNWLEAVFVLLHLTRPAARAKAIQDHLSRHARLIGNEQSEDFTTLTQTFKIPSTWVWQAKALYMRSVKSDPRDEVVYLLRAASYAEAHKTFTKQVAPLAIIERDYEGLWAILQQFAGSERTIADWNLGGKIYHDFLELVRHGAGSAPPPQLVEGLLAGLPALHESVQVRQDADVLEAAAVADMANIVAKVVVELAKKGETQLSKVLGLPLTEDAYLKYSNELAFAYYRDVMVGRG